MKNLILIFSSFVFFAHPATAEFIISEKNFTAFQTVEFRIGQNMSRTHLPSRELREQRGDYTYPPYVLGAEAPSPFDFQHQGFTVFKADPSEGEMDKLQKTQDLLVKAWGQKAYDERIAQLAEVYSLIDVRYYSFPSDVRKNEACVSVRWIARANSTINFCGLQWVTNDTFIFEITEWSDNRPGSLISHFTSQEDAEALAEVALASLKALYSLPSNQTLLIEAINRARTESP